MNPTTAKKALWYNPKIDQYITDTIEQLEHLWIGGVGDLGDNRAARVIDRVKGYKEYIKAIRQALPSKFIAYRSMEKDQFEDWKDGYGVGYIGVTFSKQVAKSWTKLAQVQLSKSKGKQILLSIPITRKSLRMRGHEGENEIVVDGEWLDPYKVRQLIK